VEPAPTAAEIAQARQRFERLERLQWLTAALSAGATREEVARIIFDRGLGLVDASAVTIFAERRPGELELLHGLGISEEFASGYRRVFADEPLPSADAHRSGEPVWLGSPEQIAARYPTLVPFATGNEVAAWADLPLRLEGGRVVVELQFAARRPFDDEERAFVLAVIRQCAEAVQRAWLFDAHRRHAERLQQLQLTSATLSAAARPRDVAAAAFRALEAVGASAAEIHVLDGPERLVLLARHGPSGGEPAEPFLRVEAPAPAAEVVRTGRALWIDSPEEIVGRYPELEAQRAARGEEAWAVVPLLASGHALGALTVGFPAARRLEPDERAFVRIVAQPCAAALERARLFEQAARSRSDAEHEAARLGALVAAAPLPLALLDLAHRFVRVNEAFARLSGLSAEAHTGRTADEVLPGAAGAQVADALHCARDGGVVVERDVLGETRAQPGVTRRLGIAAFPVRAEGVLVGVGLVVRSAR
jgi:PAS domain S-box-containing protein